jgi:prevent-host-death family protein
MAQEYGGKAVSRLTAVEPLPEEVRVRTCPLREARWKLSTLVKRALEGEPQRVTRYGKKALIIISERDWNARRKNAHTLVDLFVKTTGADRRRFADVIARQR